VLDRTVPSIISSFCGCAGERCMALPVVVVENAIADRFVRAAVKAASKIDPGLAYDNVRILVTPFYARTQKANYDITMVSGSPWEDQVYHA
jgi:malonate-semialdehyde dehydrogenase (acetylating)/methylmalonate-semialdehyde dehydrogenase